jgi:hypothetical protein
LRFGLLPAIGVNDRNIANFNTKPISNILFMDGYFQDFWSDDVLKKTFDNLSLSLSYDNKLEDKNTCVLHIRGGDFLQSDLFNVVPISWYLAQAKILYKSYDINRFCILSDDILLAQKLSFELNLNFRLPVEMKIGRDLLEDFHAIRTARYRIIGNSTFAISAAIFAEGDGVTLASKKFTKERIRNWRFINEISL